MTEGIQEPGARSQKKGGRWWIALLVWCVLLGSASLMSAATVKLYLKDGSYQLVREYKVESDRVKFLSSDRGEWEEIPVSLVDLEKTQREAKMREERVREDAATIDAEDKAEKEARHEADRVPKEAGVYLVDGEKLMAIKPGESKVVTNKRRSVLKVLSPVPMVTGKATLELDGVHSPNGTANREPEFYIRLSNEERFGMVHLIPQKGTRLVEKLTIIPVTNETVEEPELVETFRKQVGDMVYKIWPTKPLQPGEYAVVEYTDGKVNMQVWDFFIAPGIGGGRNPGARSQ